MPPLTLLPLLALHAPAPLPHATPPSSVQGRYVLDWGNVRYRLTLDANGNYFCHEDSPSPSCEWKGTYTYEGRTGLLTVREAAGTQVMSGMPLWTVWRVQLDSRLSGEARYDRGFATVRVRLTGRRRQ